MKLTPAEQAAMDVWIVGSADTTQMLRAVRAAIPIAIAEGRRFEQIVHAPVHKAEIAEVVREIVDLATDPNGPSAEWLTLVRSVAEGHYTPPGERVR